MRYYLAIAEVSILINFASMINDSMLSLVYVIVTGVLCEAWGVLVDVQSES